MDSIQALKYGSKQDIKRVLNGMDAKLLKTLLNAMLNVLENSNFAQKINSCQRSKLKPYMKTYEKLLNKKIPLKQKFPILQKSGHKYIPTFLQILGNDAYECIPESSSSLRSSASRTPRDCPICGKKDLVRLANHLSQKHNITGSEKKRILQESKDASDKHNDSGNEIHSPERDGSDEE